MKVRTWLFIALGLGICSLGLANSKTTTQTDLFSKVLIPYTELQRALSQDKIDPVKKQAEAMKISLENLLKGPLKKEEVSLFNELLTHVNNFLEAKEINEYRIQFGNISKVLIEYLKLHKEKTKSFMLLFCPMFPEGYAFWIQPKGESLANPYWGEKMLTCGVKRPW